jgi:S-adenosylmethionine:tRNA ribosyltransferase-isomerase
MHPKNISISDYTYQLPEEKIASHPLQNRGDAQLLIYKNGIIKKSFYNHISEYIPKDSLLIFNNTKVVEARLIFQKETGGIIEIFCLEPHEQYTDITAAMNQTNCVLWLCLVGGASKWKKGLILKKELYIDEKNIQLSAAFIEKRTDCFVIELSWNNDNFSFAEILHHAGKSPLPPYIKREVEENDAVRYQTVYAKVDGAVAAPTAGLHFTDEMLNSFKQKKIETEFVTLHVGAGTFKPVKAETMQHHEMHAEFFEVHKKFIEHLIIKIKNNIVAVGTTSLRTIESLYWLGCKLMRDENIFDETMPFLSQWEAYDLETKKIEIKDALNALILFLEKKEQHRLLAKTQIIIAPGYHFKIVNGLVTNFHQPSSTLLLLVAAFIGDDWRKTYNYALENDFRFLSYGDGNLLWRK